MHTNYMHLTKYEMKRIIEHYDDINLKKLLNLNVNTNLDLGRLKVSFKEKIEIINVPINQIWNTTIERIRAKSIDRRSHI